MASVVNYNVGTRDLRFHPFPEFLIPLVTAEELKARPREAPGILQDVDADDPSRGAEVVAIHLQTTVVIDPDFNENDGLTAVFSEMMMVYIQIVSQFVDFTTAPRHEISFQWIHSGVLPRPFD